jgi:preprotein translocase subunit SecY
VARGVKKTWQRIALAAAGVLLLEAGARIVMPGLTVDAVTNYLRNGGGSWLLNVYNQLGGGGLLRGAVLALGILPYATATIYARLARVVSPAMQRMARTADGRRTLARWTRVLTGGLAVVQSYGLARFVQSIPGAVAHPGAEFITQTVLLLTGGSIAAMVIAEQLMRRANDDDDDDGEHIERIESRAAGELSAPSPLDVSNAPAVDRVPLPPTFPVI